MASFIEDYSELALSLSESLTGLSSNPEEITDTLALVQSYLGHMGTQLAFAVQLGDSFGGSFGLSLREQIGALATYSHSQNTTALYTEQAQLRERLLYGATVALDEGFTASTSMAERIRVAARLVEVLGALDSLLTRSSISATVSLSLTLADVLLTGPEAALTEDVVLGDTWLERLQLYAALVELAQPSVQAQAGLSIAAVATESAELSTTLAPALSISALLTDGALVRFTFALDANEVSGWITNAEGAFPSSRFSGLAFNSLANVNGTLLAASEDGLYALDADDDSGAAIQAELVTGLLDFGTEMQKRFDSINLGIATDGTMIAKVRTVVAGTVYEDWYQLRTNTSAAPREGVLDTGRGLKSRYWQFALVNKAGADFELDAVTWYPTILDRRR